MAFRIHRGLWQFQKADGNYETKYKINESGVIVQTDASGNEVSGLTASSVAWSSITGIPSTFTPSSHTHDDRYFTESESDSRFLKKNTWDGNLYLHTDGRIYGTIMYDSNDSSYYVDPNGTSHLNDLRVNIIYDRNNTGYYLDPASTSNLNTVYTNTGYTTNVHGDYYNQQAHGNPRNNLGDPTVTEMALFNEQFNNKTAFLDPSRVTVWIQQNDGEEWQDITSNYGESAIRRFIAGYDSSSNIYIPNTVFKFRIEVTHPNYVFANALYIYWSSNSHSTKVHLWARRTDNNLWYQRTSSDTNVSSWPGHLYMPFSSIPWHPSASTTSHYNALRFEFTPNWSTGTYADRNIDLYKMQVWGGYPSGTRYPYTVNEYGDFTAIRDVYANKFIDKDNTGYYLDPVNTSNLLDVTARNITASGTIYGANFADYNDNNYYVNPASDARLRHLYVGDVAGSNDGSWNARMKVIGSSHARLDVVSNSDGIITTMYSHTGHGAGKVGTYSNHPLKFVINGSDKATLDSSGNLSLNGALSATGYNSSNWDTAYGWGNHASAGYATTSYVTTQINSLVNGAPGALNTLDELAAALGDDANFATNVTNSIAAKLPLSGGTMSGNLVLKSISGTDQMVENTYGAYLHLGNWGVGRTDATAVLVNTAYRADYADSLFNMNISRFTNDSGYLTSVPAQSWASITGKPNLLELAYSAGSAWSGNTGGSGRNLVASYHGSSGNSVISFGSANGDLNLSVDGNIYVQEGQQIVATETWVAGRGYLTSVPAQSWSSITGKPTNLSSFTNDLGNYGGWLTTSGKAADSNLLDGLDSSRFLYTTTGQFSGDWNTLTDGNQEIRLVEVHNILGGAHSNYPTGLYQYGSVLGWQLDNSTFKLYNSHTGDLAFQTGWNNDGYSGWRTIIHSANIGSQSVAYASSAGNADTVDGYHESAFWRNDQNRTIKVLNFTGVGGDSGNGRMATSYGIYQQGGAWTNPYPDLCIGYHTGIKIGAYYGYGGTRFYNNSDWATEIFSVGNGDSNVRVANNLYIGSAGGWITDLLNGKQAAGSYAAASHTHAISDVTGLQGALDGKQAAGSYLTTSGKAADSNLLDGLDLHTGRNNEANKVVRTDGNGYIQAGWINTPSGATTSTLTKIYASQDDYIRYVTPTEFRRQITDGVYQPAGSYAAASHTHAISEVTGLQGALDGKQAAGSYAASSHTHTIANITNLQGSLDSKLNGDSVAFTSFYNTFQTYTSKYNDGSLRQTAAAGSANAGVSWMYFPSAANADSPASDSGPIVISMSPGAPSATYDANTRIQQLAFGQTQGLSYRVSTSATAWTAWNRLIDTRNNSSLQTDSRNTRGVTRLYRRDSDSDYSVQTYWTGARWRLYGYVGDSNHADTHVGYADSAGSASSASTATTATNVDNGNVYTTGNNLYIKNAGVNNYRIHHTGGVGVFDVTSQFSIREMTSIWSAARFEWGNWMSYAWFDVDPWGDNWGIGSRPTSWKTVNRGSFLTFGFEDWSDRRHKSAIVEIDNAVDKVKAISGYTYWKKGSEVREGGVIAQDVLTVFPEGTGGTEEGYSVKPAALIGLLMKAVKEQQEIIDSLTARIELLENK